MTDETPDKLKREMQQQADATGAITRCWPGKARGEGRLGPGATDRAAQWLKAHRADQPLEDESAERQRPRMAQRRQRQQREDEQRNAPWDGRAPTGRETQPLTCHGKIRFNAFNQTSKQRQWPPMTDITRAH